MPDYPSPSPPPPGSNPRPGSGAAPSGPQYQSKTLPQSPNTPRANQPYPNQPYPNQPYPNQPYPNQPSPNQPHGNQGYPQPPYPYPFPVAPRPPKLQVQWPAILMLVLSTLSIVSSMFGVMHFFFVQHTIPAVLDQTVQMHNEAMSEFERRERRSAAEAGEMGNELSSPMPRPDIRPMTDLMKNFFVSGSWFALATSIGQLLVAGVTIAGSVSMMSLRRYPLAVIAAILSMLPFATPCCVLGLPLGIWALVVLFRPEVSQSFT